MIHSTETFEEAVKRLVDSAVEQGLPRNCTDPTALAEIADILMEHVTEAHEAKLAFVDSDEPVGINPDDTVPL